MKTIEELYGRLMEQAGKEMERDGVPASKVTFERKADIRYFGQAYELQVPVEDGKMNEGVWARTLERFHRLHEKSYGFKNESNPIEIVTLRLSAVGREDNGNLYGRGERRAAEPNPCLLYTSGTVVGNLPGDDGGVSCILRRTIFC